MTERPTMVRERVDAIPLVVAQMRRMDRPTLLDSHVVTPGNRLGLSLGWTTVVWLAHVLAQADHRLNQVQPWAGRRLETLRACTGPPVQEVDVTDDRLADVLRTRAADAQWTSCERGVGRTLRRVYPLSPACVRLDRTTASREGQVRAEGLFQFGYSKDQRPAVPQVTAALATLAPLGLPLATDVLPGDRADDPLDGPLGQRGRATVLQRGLLYVGACTRGALLTRARIQEGHDHYLCPVAATPVPAETLDHSLAQARASGPPERVERVQLDGTMEHLADSYACTEALSAVVDGWRPVTWTARRLLLRAVAQPRSPRRRCGRAWCGRSTPSRS